MGDPVAKAVGWEADPEDSQLQQDFEGTWEDLESHLPSP
jgi:hypothetical protein